MRYASKTCWPVISAYGTLYCETSISDASDPNADPMAFSSPARFPEPAPERSGSCDASSRFSSNPPSHMTYLPRSRSARALSSSAEPSGDACCDSSVSISAGTCAACTAAEPAGHKRTVPARIRSAISAGILFLNRFFIYRYIPSFTLSTASTARCAG